MGSGCFNEFEGETTLAGSRWIALWFFVLRYFYVFIMTGIVTVTAIIAWNTVGPSVLAMLPVLIYGGLQIRSRRPPQLPPTKVSLEEEKKSLDRIKLFSVFSIFGLLLELAVATIFLQRFALVSTPIQSPHTPAFPPGLVNELYVLLILGFIMWITASISLWSSFTVLTKVTPSQFHRPRMLVGFLPVVLYMICVGLILFLFGSHVVFDEPPAAPGSLSGPNLIPVMNFFVGLAYLGIFAPIGLVAFFGGLVLGLQRMGWHYKKSPLEFGAILFIFPFINILSPLMVFIEANAIQKKLNLNQSDGTRTMR